MNKIFNEQYELLLKDMEEITDPYHRAHIRALILQAVNNLTEVSDDDIEITITGKDAIKEDIAKETTQEKKTTSTKKNTTSKKKEIKKEEPKELDLDKDPNVTENVSEEESNNEPYIVTVEGTEYDIREAYNLLTKYEGSEEEKVELATNITVYGLTAVYEGLSILKDSDMKMTLAYYLSQYGLETINEFVESLTDGQFNDIYEFINDENIEGFLTNLEAASEEE